MMNIELVAEPVLKAKAKPRYVNNDVPDATRTSGLKAKAHAAPRTTGKKSPRDDDAYCATSADLKKKQTSPRDQDEDQKGYVKDPPEATLPSSSP